jgi:hypothetical protein
MNKYSNHGYTVSQLLNYGVDKSLMSKQDSTDMMIQHRPKGICIVTYTRSLNSRMSSKLFNVMAIKFFGQQVLTIAHVDVSMFLSNR